MEDENNLSQDYQNEDEEELITSQKVYKLKLLKVQL